MPPLVIVTETLDQGCADWLAQRVELVWCRHDETAKLAELLPGAAGLVVRTYTQVNDALLDQAPRLQVVGRAGVGLDNFDLDSCRRRGVRVVHAPDANTQAVIEYVLGLILDELRPRETLPGYVTPEQFHELRKTCVGTQLDRLTLGILGFGRIGRRLARAAYGLGVKTLVNDLIDEAEVRREVDFPFEYVAKPDLYARSDVLSIHVDGRSENRRMIDAEVLGQLKPTCLLINAARGMLVDSAALADWAKSHVDGRIILDVHNPEPPPPEYPLYGLANVRLLPHLASRTGRALENMSWVVKDVVAVLQGEQPRYPAT